MERTRTNASILVCIGIAFLGLLALALWGFGQGAAPQTPPTQVAAKASGMTEAQAKAEVKRLLAELDSFKTLAGFHDGAFSEKGLPQAARWRQDATALQARISNDTALPAILRAAPGTLLGLGLAYQQHKGQESQGTRSDRELVLEAVK